MSNPSNELLAKLESDASASACLVRIISHVDRNHAVSFFRDTVPDRHYALQAQRCPPWRSPQQSMWNLVRSFLASLEILDPELPRDVQLKFLRLILHETNGAHITHFRRFFFRGCDLHHLALPDRQTVKDHLIGCLTYNPSEEDLLACAGIGPFLSCDEALHFVPHALKIATRPLPFHGDGKNRAMQMLANEIHEMSCSVTRVVSARLAKWGEGDSEHAGWRQLSAHLSSLAS